MILVMMGLWFWLMGMFMFFVNREYLLMILMSIEVMMLGFFVMLMFELSISMMELVIVFLIMMVLEACLSLMMMILMVKNYGSDMIKFCSLVNV